MNTPRLECFDHLAIEVRNLESSLEFYTRAFGLAQLEAPSAAAAKRIVWLSLPEGKMLHLVETSEGIPNRIGHFALRVSDLDQWRTHLSLLGIPEEPATVPLYGTVERIFLRDPSGNRIELVRWTSNEVAESPTGFESRRTERR